MPLRMGSPLPPFSGATGWLNQALTPAALANMPLLVHFWAVSCHICHETMTDLMRYRDQYKDRIRFVGVHMPRQEADVDEAKVRADIATYGITQPVALDHQHQVAEQFQNQFVPAFFLFDAAHTLRFRAAGDKGFANLAPKIAELLAAP